MEEAFSIPDFLLASLNVFVTFLFGNWSSYPMWYHVNDIFSWEVYSVAKEMVQSWPSFFVWRQYLVTSPFLDSTSTFWHIYPQTVLKIKAKFISEPGLSILRPASTSPSPLPGYWLYSREKSAPCFRRSKLSSCGLYSLGTIYFPKENVLDFWAHCFLQATETRTSFASVEGFKEKGIAALCLIVPLTLILERFKVRLSNSIPVTIVWALKLMRGIPTVSLRNGVRWRKL